MPNWMLALTDTQEPPRTQTHKLVGQQKQQCVSACVAAAAAAAADTAMHLEVAVLALLNVIVHFARLEHLLVVDHMMQRFDCEGGVQQSSRVSWSCRSLPSTSRFSLPARLLA